MGRVRGASSTVITSTRSRLPDSTWTVAARSLARTGRFFACEHEGVVPDLVAVAKGLGAGYQPIGALLVSKAIAEAIVQGSGFFQHGHTYLGHPVAAAAGHAVLTAILDRGLVPRVADKGEVLAAHLEEAFGQHPHVGDIRGRGLFQGLEFVANRASKEPFPADQAIARRLKARAMENGLICYPMAGTVDGRRGDHVLLAPPFIISEDQLDEICGKLSRSLDEALAEARG